eukprot:TRINITY_DN44351_c0_g1_i1.p1 TRINITY_DN44351_c0_g1~~TRINITY_DN44351_c0_g1_i1.p1  ORF type:complete len:768 (-),score=82.82 TRINITY_DN44351_c0_g1_i1:9-2312(-)
MVPPASLQLQSSMSSTRLADGSHPSSPALLATSLLVELPRSPRSERQRQHMMPKSSHVRLRLQRAYTAAQGLSRRHAQLVFFSAWRSLWFIAIGTRAGAKRQRKAIAMEFTRVRHKAAEIIGRILLQIFLLVVFMAWQSAQITARRSRVETSLHWARSCDVQRERALSLERCSRVLRMNTWTTVSWWQRMFLDRWLEACSFLATAASLPPFGREAFARRGSSQDYVAHIAQGSGGCTTAATRACLHAWACYARGAADARGCVTSVAQSVPVQLGTSQHSLGAAFPQSGQLALFTSPHKKCSSSDNSCSRRHRHAGSVPAIVKSLIQSTQAQGVRACLQAWRASTQVGIRNRELQKADEAVSELWNQCQNHITRTVASASTRSALETKLVAQRVINGLCQLHEHARDAGLCARVFYGWRSAHICSFASTVTCAGASTSAISGDLGEMHAASLARAERLFAMSTVRQLLGRFMHVWRVSTLWRRSSQVKESEVEVAERRAMEAFKWARSVEATVRLILAHSGRDSVSVAWRGWLSHTLALQERRRATSFREAVEERSRHGAATARRQLVEEACCFRARFYLRAVFISLRNHTRQGAVERLSESESDSRQNVAENRVFEDDVHIQRLQAKATHAHERRGWPASSCVRDDFCTGSNGSVINSERVFDVSTSASTVFCGDPAEPLWTGGEGEDILLADCRSEVPPVQSAESRACSAGKQCRAIAERPTSGGHSVSPRPPRPRSRNCEVNSRVSQSPASVRVSSALRDRCTRK